jgi:pimeloyl-ACP methyl ester carboxylesterase
VNAKMATLAAGTVRAHVDYDRRRVRYTMTCQPRPGQPLAVVFVPLGSSSTFVGSAEFVAAANEMDLCCLCVDRPGIGGTTKSPRRWIDCVRTRLRVHSADVAAVLAAVNKMAGVVRLIGVCAGAPFALAFAAAYPLLIDRSHLTLVTPWVSGECKDNRWIVSRAGSGWFGPHTTVGPLLALVQFPRMRKIVNAPSAEQSLRRATVAFTPSERDLLTRRCRLDETLAARIVAAVRSDLGETSLGAFAGDVAVCLAPSKVIFRALRPPTPKKPSPVWRREHNMRRSKGGSSTARTATRPATGRRVGHAGVAADARAEEDEDRGGGGGGGGAGVHARPERFTVVAARQDELVPLAATAFL